MHPKNRHAVHSFGAYVMLHPGLRLGEGISIGSFSEIGKPYRPVDGAPLPARHTFTRIGERTHVGSHVIIGKGCQISPRCLIDDRTWLEQDVVVGTRTKLINGTHVSNWVKIGADSIISSPLVGERTKIGNRVRLFGSVVHKQNDPATDWDDAVERSAVIRDDSFIGWGAVVIGPVRVGPNAFVAANATVTKDVPPGHIATGVNKIVPRTAWTGPLRKTKLLRV